MYCVIYDGDCNLCTTLVQWLEYLDGGQRFRYGAMQDNQMLEQFDVTAADCELGMLLIDRKQPPHVAGREVMPPKKLALCLPAGALFVAAYRGLPGLKRSGDRIYAFVRDKRYRLFGRRASTYKSTYSVCKSDRCDQYF